MTLRKSHGYMQINDPFLSWFDHPAAISLIDTAVYIRHQCCSQVAGTNNQNETA